jgi:hypothetical protein
VSSASRLPALGAVESHYNHSKAARAIAEEYFSSDKVLMRSVEGAMEPDV